MITIPIGIGLHQDRRYGISRVTSDEVEARIGFKVSPHRRVGPDSSIVGNTGPVTVEIQDLVFIIADDLKLVNKILIVTVYGTGYPCNIPLHPLLVLQKSYYTEQRKNCINTLIKNSFHSNSKY